MSNLLINIFTIVVIAIMAYIVFFDRPEKSRNNGK